MASQAVPIKMLCDNRECQHPLENHSANRQHITIEDLKTATFPCLYFDREGQTFAVCACRDFELPALGTEGKAAETPDEPIHTISMEYDVNLILWASGRVTWDPK